ncbi:hypothetical protein M0802_003925 [Mischocyttarus mexicanus]|nr:hypothetical protein M0802_003925 [Mischocyttarus mexicanus]
MFTRRACSESGPHPGIPGSGPVGSGHLWGKRNQGRTSAPVVGDVKQPSIILKTRRSWPVAPTHCRRRLNGKLRQGYIAYAKRASLNVCFRKMLIYYLVSYYLDKVNLVSKRPTYEGFVPET